MEATKRTRGRKWMQLRASAMIRDCGLCQPCARQGRLSIAVDVDHIKALTNGGTDDPDNLQAICKACHDDKTRADMGLKPKHTTGIDGWPER